MSGLDFKKLRELQPELHKQAREERLEEVAQYLLSYDFIEILSKDRFLKELQQSPRVLTHWKQSGIIPEKSSGKRKKEYSRTELIWLNLVSELRNLGLPIDLIKQLKESILDKSEDLEFSIFEYAIIYSIVVEPMILVIEAEGGIPKLLSKSDYKLLLEEADLPIHIHINILNLCEQEFPNNSFKISFKSPNSNLSEQEITLLYCLRTGDYSEMKIKMKNGEICHIEGHKKHDPSARIMDLIKSHDYQDISIKVSDGKIVCINNIEKTKTV